jgi:hypothetical protein
MKKLLVLLTTAAAFSLLPAVSQALCIRSGQIPRINVASTAVSSIGVRESNPVSIFYNFTTTSVAVLNTAAAAQASHERVTVVGDAAVCGAVVGNVSAGGGVISILVAP